MREEVPEYLILLGPPATSAGTLKVIVREGKSNGKKLPIAEKSILSNELYRLINPTTQKFYEKMSFDEYVMEIKRYELDPHESTLTIITK